MLLTTVTDDLKTCPLCGVHYALDAAFARLKWDQGGDWYCPNGHNLIFTETKAQKLQKQLDAERKKIADQQETIRYFDKRLSETVQERDNATRNWKSTKTRLRKTKERVANGVCPCCNRNFENLQRHIRTKHPAYATP